MAIDPRLLIQMLAVSKSRSISQAAAEIGVTQPALSNSIAVLERQLGVRLLDRSRQGSKLTAVGSTVSRWAAALESIMSSMVEEVKAQSAGVSGPLAIGVTPINAAILIPEAVARMLEQMPDLKISVLEDADDRLLDLLIKGKIEFSVGPIGVDPIPSGVIEEPLTTDPFALIVRRKHPLAKARSLRLRDVIGEKWILPPPDHGSAYRRHIDAIFLTAGMPIPQDSVHCSSRATFEELLLKTDRITIMSQKLMSKTKSFVCIRLQDAGTPRQLGIKRLSQIQLSPLADTLITLLREEASASSLVGRGSASRAKERKSRKRSSR